MAAPGLSTISKNLFLSAQCPVRGRGPARNYRGHKLLAAAILAASIAGCESSGRTGWIGLNTQLSEAASAGAVGQGKATSLQACAEYLTELEVPHVREAVMNWAVLQPSPGPHYKFSFSDPIVRAVQETEAELLAVFRGIPGWASDMPNAGPVGQGLPPRHQAQAFTEFVTSFVERYDADGRQDMPKLRGPIRAYQFMDGMEEIPTGQYAYWLKLFYRAVKATDARAVVVLGGLRSPGVKMVDAPAGSYAQYFEHLLADPELSGPVHPCFDVAAFQNYPADYPGRSPFDDAVAYLRQTMADHDLSRPIWLTAYGDRGSDEKDRADNIIKWSVKARTLGIARLYLCCLCEPAGGRTGSGRNSGLLRRGEGAALVRTPAFNAFRKLVAESASRPDVTFKAEGLYALTGKGEPRYVIWKEETHNPAPLPITGWWAVEGWTGGRTVRQGSEIRLTGSPLFIERTTSPFIH